MQEEINKNKEELLKIEESLQESLLSEGIAYLQKIILNLHSRIISYMDYIILDLIDKEFRNRAALSGRIISNGKINTLIPDIDPEKIPTAIFSGSIRAIVEGLSFGIKMKTIRKHDKNFCVEKIKLSQGDPNLIEKFNSIRNDFAHPFANKCNEKYNFYTPEGKKRIKEAQEVTIKIYEYFKEYGKNLKVHFVLDE